MVAAVEARPDLSALVNNHVEWLLVRENGRTFPIRNSELEIERAGERLLFGFFDDKAFRTCRVSDFSANGNEINIEIAADFGLGAEQIRLVARESAAELAANVELARLQRANRIAAAIVDAFPEFKLKRVALCNENGRHAQIFLESSIERPVAVLADVTGTCNAESLLASAILWLAKLELRTKDPIDQVWITCGRKRAREIQKLAVLLCGSQARRISVVEITEKSGTTKAVLMPNKRFADLWREKPKKLTLPMVEQSETARWIIELSPENIDVIYSKHGETLRFRGLPFARVRRMLGREKAWFGIDKKRKLLEDRSEGELLMLVDELGRRRSVSPSGKRHEFYRLAAESWLESLLKRNIKLLDENLILSPIYNQFRTSADKIDLLAIRRDGRLVIIELKTTPDREMVLQAADYWRKIELQRRRGELERAGVFGEMKILDKPALVYAVAPALSFHRDFERFARMLSPEIELWRFELHERWREEVKVIARRDYSE